MYINLMLVEEAKAIVGWEGIRDTITAEDHARTSSSSGVEDKTSLSGLSAEDFSTLKVSTLLDV